MLPFIVCRYIENTRCHSLYRPYCKEVPSYLHNRPRHLIDTSMDKIAHAEEIPAYHIKTTDMDGVFKVKSQDVLERWYLYHFEMKSSSLPVNATSGCAIICHASTSLPYLGIIQNGDGRNYPNITQIHLCLPWMRPL